MYKLYGNVAGWKLLDNSKREKDIADTMISYANTFELYDYLITKAKGEGSDYKEAPYKRIIGKKQFTNYLEKIKEQQEIENMSCIELKKYIVKKI